MSDAVAWFGAHTIGAPPALRARAEAYLARADARGSTAAQLAEAASLALEDVVLKGRERAAALDLLTADSLLTLALLAQAEVFPAELDRFASRFVSAASA